MFNRLNHKIWIFLHENVRDCHGASYVGTKSKKHKKQYRKLYWLTVAEGLTNLILSHWGLEVEWTFNYVMSDDFKYKG